MESQQTPPLLNSNSQAKLSSKDGLKKHVNRMDHDLGSNLYNSTKRLKVGKKKSWAAEIASIRSSQTSALKIMWGDPDMDDEFDVDDLDLDTKILVFFLLNDIALEVAKTHAFHNLMSSLVGSGSSSKVPSYSALVRDIPSRANNLVDAYVCDVKKSWVKTGCTIVLLRVISGSSLVLYFLSYSPAGIFLLLTKDVEGSEEDEKFQGRVQVYASDVVKSLGSVPVLQFMCGISSFQFPDEVINDYAGVYSTRCTGCEIGQLLKDICEVEWVMEVRKRVELIAHCRNMLPDEIVETATGEKCALDVGSCFLLLLSSVLELKSQLVCLVNSLTWGSYDQSSNRQELELIIGNPDFWTGLTDVLDILKPLFQIFLLVNRKTHTTGYLYEAMEMIKDAIKRKVDNNEAKYLRVLSLIEGRYHRIVHEVHAFAAILNPSYMLRKNINESSELMKSKDYVVRHLVKEEDTGDFLGEFCKYIKKGRSIFTEQAALASNTHHPYWWWHHPHLCESAPVLQRYAVAILSQPCSSSLCGRFLVDFLMEEAQASNGEKTLKSCKAKGVTLGRELVGKDVRMNIFLMEKYKEREAQVLKPIDLQSLINELPRLEEEDVSSLMEYLG